MGLHSCGQRSPRAGLPHSAPQLPTLPGGTPNPALHNDTSRRSAPQDKSAGDFPREGFWAGLEPESKLPLWESLTAGPPSCVHGGMLPLQPTPQGVHNKARFHWGSGVRRAGPDAPGHLPSWVLAFLASAGSRVPSKHSQPSKTFFSCTHCHRNQ